MGVKIATQQELDQIHEKFLNNPRIYPYTSVCKYNGRWLESRDDWDGFILITEDMSGLMKVSIKRAYDNGFTLSLFTENKIAAGKLLKALDRLIVSYRPMYIETFVHASNVDSIRINKKRFGDPYGIDPMGAWNMGTGKWEDMLMFKKIL